MVVTNRYDPGSRLTRDYTLRRQAELDELYATALAAYLTWDLADGDSTGRVPRLPAPPRTRVTEDADAAAAQVRKQKPMSPSGVTMVVGHGFVLKQCAKC